MVEIIIYIAAISLMAVFLTVYDKYNAVHRKRRVPEKTLMITGFFGGALAMYITMKIIRHKTLHKKFMIGLPIFILIHCILVLVLIFI